MSVIHVSDQNFIREVVQSHAPVVIEFIADWASPIQGIVPVFDELSQIYRGKAKFAMMDIDQNDEWPVLLGVTTLPRVLIFDHGKIIADQSGATPHSVFKDWVVRSLGVQEELAV